LLSYLSLCSCGTTCSTAHQRTRSAKHRYCTTATTHRHLSHIPQATAPPGKLFRSKGACIRMHQRSGACAECQDPEATPHCIHSAKRKNECTYTCPVTPMHASTDSFSASPETPNAPPIQPGMANTFHRPRSLRQRRRRWDPRLELRGQSQAAAPALLKLSSRASRQTAREAPHLPRRGQTRKISLLLCRATTQALLLL
jgi:hypothetical protein